MIQALKGNRNPMLGLSPLHPEDDPQMIIDTECEILKTFYTKNVLPQKEVWSPKGSPRFPSSEGKF